jgi:hypothetical protein
MIHGAPWFYEEKEKRKNSIAPYGALEPLYNTPFLVITLFDFRFSEKN